MIPDEAVEADPQCTEVAGVEYGWEIRCILEAGHEGAPDA